MLAIIDVEQLEFEARESSILAARAGEVLVTSAGGVGMTLAAVVPVFTAAVVVTVTGLAAETSAVELAVETWECEARGTGDKEVELHGESWGDGEEMLSIASEINLIPGGFKNPCGNS